VAADQVISNVQQKSVIQVGSKRVLFIVVYALMLGLSNARDATRAMQMPKLCSRTHGTGKQLRGNMEATYGGYIQDQSKTTREVNLADQST
jgi:hypothetical protein